MKVHLVRSSEEQTISNIERIHLDDSVYVIKHKLIHALRQIKIDVAYDEIYLFTISNKYIHLHDIYQQITKNETRDITPELFGQLLLRFDLDIQTIESIPVKQKYDLNDILFLEKKPVKQPIGKHFSKYDDFLFSANPYELIDIHFFENKYNTLLHLEGDLLLNYIGNKTEEEVVIYVCIAEDVLPIQTTKSEYILEMYFPQLYLRGIKNIFDLENQRGELIEETKKTVNNELMKYYQTINSFYDYAGQTKYVESGIKSFSFTIPSIKQINNIPLDAIFKNIHATKTVPFIKYNPGNKQESIYRLYTEQISTNGKKIPFLTEKNILKLSREIGRRFCISLYILGDITLFMDIEKSGNIVIYVLHDLVVPISIHELYGIIDNTIKPIIETINGFLEQTGYVLGPIEYSLIQFKKMKYIATTEISNLNHLLEYIHCFSSIFDIYSKDMNEGMEMQYKRVENYRIMDGQTILISKLLKTYMGEEDAISKIVQQLLDQYNLTRKRAEELVHAYIKNKQEGLNDDIVNSGFPSLLYIEPHTNKLKIEIEDILSVSYLNLIITYVDSLFHILQMKKDKINKICPSNTTKKMVSSPPPLVIITKEETEEDMDNPFELYGYDDEEEKEEDNTNQNADEDVIYYDDDLFTPDEEDGEGEQGEEKEQSGQEEQSNEQDKQSNEQEEEDENPFSLYDSYDPYQDGFQEEKTGGQSDNEETKYNINPVGKKLKNNDNFFYNRLIEREPTLFLKEDKKKNIKSYARICPSSSKLQPVILTDEELADMNPDAYTKVLKYGTGEKKYNYICPRYWCFLTNKPITHEDVMAGKCGKIIGENDNVIKEGHYVYEFNNKREHIDVNGNYIPHYPGFKDKKSHPDNKCIPCCFSQWDSKEQKTRRNECLHNIEPAKKNTNTNYVISVDTYPLEQNRFGKLPISVQHFLRIDYSLFLSNKNEFTVQPPNIAGCLIRYGVEQKPKQSFLGCIADIYAATQNIPTPSIAEFKQILVNKTTITLDTFIRYHNGSLVSIFMPKKKQDVDIDVYQTTAFYQSIHLENEIQVDFLKDTILSYENFLLYLADDTVEIDHTYLWDMFIDPNEKLIKGGVNLAIIEIPNNDITDNIEILCPTNSYMNTFYDENKSTVLLLKHDVFYEPIYLYSHKIEEGKIKNHLIKTFIPTDKTVKSVLKIIRIISKQHCSPKMSLPKTYEFKQNIGLYELIQQLDNIGYTVHSQIMNYHNKIIGVLSNKKSNPNEPIIYIPCLPSSSLEKIPIQYTDDLTIWQDYSATVSTLKRIHQLSEGEILCRPTHKIIDDALIVGILTETNQFVRINPPSVIVPDDGMIPIDNADYMLLDNTITRSTKTDSQREEKIMKLKLEEQFYIAFRTLLKKTLNETWNKTLNQEWLNVIEEETMDIFTKRRKIEKKIRDILQSKVVFAEYDPKVLSSLTLTENEKPYYMVSNENQLMIPMYNLITGKVNNTIYFTRLADELIRYKQIQLFMFSSNVFLIDTNYKIHSDEFLLLHSLLVGDYFKDLIPFNTNHYLNNITHNNADPLVSQPYSSKEISLEMQENILKMENENVYSENPCIVGEFEIQGNNRSEWKIAFPVKTKEIEFKNSPPNCSFEILRYIWKDVGNIRDILYNGYEKYAALSFDKIRYFLINDGKIDLMNKCKTIEELKQVLYSDEYYITDFDIWVFANEVKINILLYSSTSLKNIQWEIDNVETNWLVLYGKSVNEEYYYIRSPPQNKTNYKNKIPSYKLINGKFPLVDLKYKSETFQHAFNGDEIYRNNIRSLDKYIEESNIRFIIKRKNG